MAYAASTIPTKGAIRSVVRTSPEGGDTMRTLESRHKSTARAGNPGCVVSFILFTLYLC